MFYRECCCLIFVAFSLVTFSNVNSVKLDLKDWSLKNVMFYGESKTQIGTWIGKHNWKECAWNNVADGKDNGLIKSCSFKKKNSNTSLRVVVSSNMRVYSCDVCCKRWYVAFNGKECSPVPIDGVVYMWKGKGTADLHRPRVITGHCQNIAAGTVNVGFYVGNCKGFKNADAHTGWNSATRIYVEEKEPMQS